MAKITEKTFKEALVNSGGNQARIAEKMEKSRQAVGNFLKKRPKMRELLDLEVVKLVENAEDVVAMEILSNRDIDQSKWLLTNSKVGKARGWGAKQEIEHSGEERPHIFNLIVKSVEEIKSEKLDNQPKAA